MTTFESLQPMPPLPALLPLTLIVATTPSLGIGLRGSLPWPPLKSDLAFFARITKRPPPSLPSSSFPTNQARKTRNAVIMGRKTWESLPEKVRPLKGRINVVVSRNRQKLDLGEGEGAFGVGSVEEGVRRLQDVYPSLPRELSRSLTNGGEEEDEEGEGHGLGLEHERQEQGKLALGRVFVIGGADIYKLALRLPSCERILWTRLRGEWECDTFFPEGILPEEGEGRGKWVRRSNEEMEEWIGEEGVGGLRREGEVEFEILMAEREGVGRRKEDDGDGLSA